MIDHLEDRPTENTQPRRFQFSLRTLFIVSFFIAILCAGIFCKYDAVRQLTEVVALLMYSSSLLGIAIYGRGYVRTYAIGACFPLTILLYPGFLQEMEMTLSGSQIYSVPQINPFTERFLTTKASTMDEGIPYFVPSLVILGYLLYTNLSGGTMVLTRWLIDRSRRQEPVAENPIAKHVDPVLQTEWSEADATENAVR